MNKFIVLLAYLAVALYVVFIVTGGRDVSGSLYLLADIFVFVIMTTLVFKSDKKNPFLMISIIWLIANYILRTHTSSPLWFAFDGFTVATLLTEIVKY